jgi:hypothetical protein
MAFGLPAGSGLTGMNPLAAYLKLNTKGVKGDSVNTFAELFRITPDEANDLNKIKYDLSFMMPIAVVISSCTKHDRVALHLHLACASLHKV